MGAGTQPHQPADEGDPEADAPGLGWLPPPLLGEARLGLPGTGAAGQFVSNPLGGRGPFLPAQVRGTWQGAEVGLPHRRVWELLGILPRGCPGASVPAVGA